MKKYDFHEWRRIVQRLKAGKPVPDDKIAAALESASDALKNGTTTQKLEGARLIVGLKPFDDANRRKAGLPVEPWDIPPGLIESLTDGSSEPV